MIGHRVAGEGAARRVALELVDQDGGARDALEGGAPDELERTLGLQDAHGVTGLPGQASQLDSLVGGYPARNSEKDARHARLPLGAVVIRQLVVGDLLERDLEVVLRT